MKIIRTITYEGPEPVVRRQLRLSLPDGQHDLLTKITITTDVVQPKRANKPNGEREGGWWTKSLHPDPEQREEESK